MQNTNNQLIELIYQSAIEDGLFLDLYEQLAALQLEQHEAEGKEQELLQHFRQSMAIAEHVNQLNHQKSLAEKIIDQLSTAIILLDSNAGVIHCNQQAKLLTDEDERINIVDDQLTLTDSDRDQQLRQTLQSWQQHASANDEAMLIGDTSNKASVMILSPAEAASQLLHEHLPQSACAVLFIAGNKTPSKEQNRACRISIS